jgi:hypothetical protein
MYAETISADAVQLHMMQLLLDFVQYEYNLVVVLLLLLLLQVCHSCFQASCGTQCKSLQKHNSR